MNRVLFLSLIGLVLFSCSTTEKKLPYLGNHDVIAPGDTAYYSIPKFSFVNQDSAEVSHNDYQGHVYVVDFFFSTCPTICPIMTSEMVRLRDLLKEEKLYGDVKLLSHTVNPDYDKPQRLKEYALMMGADFEHWNFVTGEKEDLYYQAEEGYMMTAFPSDTAEGGFFHSDNFVLIDRAFHVRGIYDGTSSKSVDQLFNDIKTLVNE